MLRTGFPGRRSRKEDYSMKRLIARVLILALLAAATLLAQRPFGVLTSSTQDPATIVQNRVTRLTAFLELNSSQAAQATTIFTNAQAALAPFETSLKQA